MSMRKIAVIFLTVGITPVAHASTLCHADEVAVFSCQLKENKKFVSVCTSRNISDKTGFMQYRYGTEKNVELSYPDDKLDSQSKFGYDSYDRPDLSTFILGFDNSNYRYEISETTEGGADDGVTARALLVTSEVTKHTITLNCLNNQNLISHISTLEAVVPCDKEHEIVDGSCN
ncbi:hypothetical protein PQR02_21015 [Paraburkholderia sediminicola]|uniref:Uncharacterized protein n=1 Tax=Paraburkholderia rhynchosiae TaxID=487049 RepID=A0ACC7NAD7_9BURK